MVQPTRSYKYNCRKCPIRQQCIDAKSYGPGLKSEIAHRFTARTDTFETWDLLQQDCLRIRQDREGAQRESGESRLLRRLRQSRQSSQRPPMRRSSPISSPQPPPPQPVPRPRPKPIQPPSSPEPEPPAAPAAGTRGFEVLTSGRTIRMPENGDLVFGRFEQGFSGPPDVDLGLEDGEVPSVSRRHALIISRGGQHWIEDMGSSNGTYINGHQLGLGKSVRLSPGDRLLLGRCRLVYTTLPGWMAEPDPRLPHVANLVITHTGHRFRLPDRIEIMLGRPDPGLGYLPDLDLSIAGEAAFYVSRRHARISHRSGWHFLEDMGSAAGTRINGRAILVGQSPIILQPGDHFWLGGCVLAYEWQLLQGASGT
jgi:pSer/pThr/pTyr-binding forkhead associated (FHA) protein